MKSLPKEVFEKVVLCLNLTASANDNESASALRGANRILASHGTSWAKIIDEIYAQAVVQVKTRQEPEVSISPAIDELLAVLGPGSFRDMIKSYDEQWRDRRSLSERQRTVLGDAWRKHSANLDVYKRKPPSWLSEAA